MVEELVSNIGVVEKLQNFQYKDAKGKDWGLNVRNRAKELANFVLNPDRVRSERAKVPIAVHPDGGMIDSSDFSILQMLQQLSAPGTCT